MKQVRLQSLFGCMPLREMLTWGSGGMALVLKEPYGVVVGIAPWNAALLLGLRAVCAPIACGNTVV
jgi:acyl-CoA reductase-like NAD-dependent aldehyde dehydrogenase